MNQNIYIHKVIFAGAGPGDPELITLKTVQAPERSGSSYYRPPGQ